VHITKLQKKLELLEEEIYLDDLTKCHNRKWLFDKLLKSLNFKEKGVISFVDIDKFKDINDSYGHLVGDKVLYLIASMLKEIDDSYVVRYGGDEFIVLSFNSTAKKIELSLEKINNSFKTKSLKCHEDRFKTSISFGIYEFEKGDIFFDILEIVDARMYEHKRRRKEIVLS
jgi:diguanylate cyclase (GGDEF)-like protein